jgi:hypothetical protein
VLRVASGKFSGGNVTRELKSAIRLFSTSPLFALTVLLTMALGIGTGAAVFSVVDTVLLRPLPFPDPDRLVSVWARDVKGGEQYVEIAPQTDFRGATPVMIVNEAFVRALLPSTPPLGRS